MIIYAIEKNILVKVDFDKKSQKPIIILTGSNRLHLQT